MKYKVLPALLFFLWASFAFAKTCPTASSCTKFYRQEKACEKDSKKCAAFMKTFANLLDKYDCKRDFDKDPVPAVWLCGNHESAVALLRSLQTRAAKDLYKSPKFQATLDGALAEGASDGTED